MSGAFLRCAGLRKRYGDVVAVRDASLDVERGTTMALLGPSGCGKTTLLRLIAGFEHPDAGAVTLGGRELVGPRAFVKPEHRRVGMVFQDFALFPHLSVASNVAFGMRGRRHRARVEELLELVGLRGLGGRMPHELSGGQQQRVALARSLAAEPDLILLDEPFSNLDPAMRQRVRAEVRGILESIGTTALFVTHDQEEALSLAERVAVMLDGTIRQAGGPADVYRSPAGRDVAEFLGEANFLPAEAHDGVARGELGAVPVPPGVSGQVDLMVRPEGIRLSHASSSSVCADVVSEEYYGHDRMIALRLPSGALVRVRDTPGEPLTPGTRVGLAVRGEVLVFPRATAPSLARSNVADTSRGASDG